MSEGNSVAEAIKGNEIYYQEFTLGIEVSPYRIQNKMLETGRVLIYSLGSG